MPFTRTGVAGRRYIPKVDKPEQKIQKAVCRYLNTHYPNVMYQSDVVSGMPIPESMRWIINLYKSMQSSHAHPDLKIFARSYDGKYSGLALELKADGTSVILKIGKDKGKLSKDEHIREQAKTLRQLNAEGWYANFAVGYDEAIKMIDWYFGRQQLPF